MIKIDKTYTIAFGYAGVPQQVDIRESKGKIINPRIWVNYMRVDSEHYKIAQSIEKMTNINDILDAIKLFANRGVAEIKYINHAPIEYSKDPELKEYVKSVSQKIDDLMEVVAKEYFERVLEPLIIENKWFMSRSHIGYPILIDKGENDEWQNIKDVKKEFYFEYLCYLFVKNFNKGECDLNNERAKGFVFLFNMIDEDYFRNKNLIVDF
jgi:hypothetical protein